jgi:hypothetical protein
LTWGNRKWRSRHQRFTSVAGIEDLLAGLGDGISKFAGDLEGSGSIPCSGKTRTTRPFFWWSQLTEGASVEAAPWWGGGGVVRWFTEKKKNEGDEEENGGGAREGRC